MVAMADRLMRFGKAFAALLGVAATIYAIVTAGRWWAWLLFVVVLLAGAYAVEAWKYFVRAYRYPQLEERIALLEAANQGHEIRIEQLEEEAQRQYKEGVEEGMVRIIGSNQSQYHAPPRLVALSGQAPNLRLVGEYEADDPPPRLTRYQVQVEATGEPRGVVEVDDVVAELHLVHMKCIERTVNAFWTGIEEKAITDPTPPPGVCLVPMSYPPPLALQRLQIGEPGI